MYRGLLATLRPWQDEAGPLDVTGQKTGTYRKICESWASMPLKASV